MSKSVTSVQELGALANNLTQSYSSLAAESCRIARVCPAPQVFIFVMFSLVLSKSVYIMHLPKLPNVNVKCQSEFFSMAKIAIAILKSTVV